MTDNRSLHLSMKQEQQQHVNQCGYDSAPERPPPPIVGKVTHYSIDLYWDAALEKANLLMRKGDGRMRVCVQEKDQHGGWGIVYTGYSSRHTQEGLEPKSDYQYRMRFMNDHGNSEWSPGITVATTRQPKTGEDIHRAVLHQNVSLLISVLDSGDINGPPDIPDKFGFTPLMQASQKGDREEIIDILVERGADVNHQNDSGKTALMLSCFAGQTGSVRVLTMNKAKYDIRDKGGSTALHWAMDSGNTELIEYILDLPHEPGYSEAKNGKIDINCTDANGWTPLLRCASVGGNKNAANVLLRYGANVNVRDKDGKTALMIAVVNGHQPLVEALLEKDADVQIKNDYGKTAYDMACSMERRRIIKTMEDKMTQLGIKFL